MNRFNRPGLRKRITESMNFSVFFFVAVIIAFLVGISFIASTSSRDQTRILTDAVNKDIIHCYAVEGYYPPSLKYIENHYGLTYDKERYIVDYVPIGDNIMPSVTIVEIKKE
ncbi:MAG: hypothetical protein K6E49_01450 [Lachnospiraceae bacterium]|nr:hypothetical protein [Lachnospiraceae bacterium]